MKSYVFLVANVTNIKALFIQIIVELCFNQKLILREERS